MKLIDCLSQSVDKIEGLRDKGIDGLRDRLPP